MSEGLGAVRKALQSDQQRVAVITQNRAHWVYVERFMKQVLGEPFSHSVDRNRWYYDEGKRTISFHTIHDRDVHPGRRFPIRGFDGEHIWFWREEMDELLGVGRSHAG